MKTYQINRLLVVAAVAILPVACGTSSPTGPDFAADATMSALRTESTTPQAPQAPSPEQVPNPVPSPKPSPKPTPDPTSVDTAPSAPVPSEPTETTETTDRRNGRPVAPQPEPSADVNEPDVDTAGPAVQPGVETGRTVLPTRPAGNPGDTGGVPAPPVVKCDAFSLEIVTTSTFAPATGLALEAILRGRNGLAITDASCETLLWQAEGSSSSTRVVITHGSDSRYVTITGLMTGRYKIGATAPNGVTSSIAIDVQ